MQYVKLGEPPANLTTKRKAAIALIVVGAILFLVGVVLGFMHQTALNSAIIAGDLFAAELTAAELPFFWILILFGGGGGFLGAIFMAAT